MSAFLIILMALCYVVMMSVMIIMDRDKPRDIIIWSFVFLLTQIVGYIIFISLKIVITKKRNNQIVKKNEDEIYLNLVKKDLLDNKFNSNYDLFKFNELAFGASTTKHNKIDFFDSVERAKSDIQKEMKSAKTSILFEISKFDSSNFELWKPLLVSKAEAGVLVKISSSSRFKLKLKKELKKAGCKLYVFNKGKNLVKPYSNLRNIITIDGTVAFIGNFSSLKNKGKTTQEIECSFIKIKGDAVQEINLTMHQDIVFASGKYFDFDKNEHTETGEIELQYVANHYDTDVELMVIKAICMAKNSIQLELSEFIPTESIMSLLKFAINSNIMVKLMVPIKSVNSGKHYATRAYAKELALFGANVYLFDGYIRTNSIMIDDECVLVGGFIMDREHISTCLQDILVIRNETLSEYFKKKFDKAIGNSYRINDAKFMLLKEKFFKNFV